MNKSDVRLVKKKILKCLTEDFEYRVSRKKVRNYALFDRQEGYAVFNNTDLEMVMDAVVRGLYLGLVDSGGSEE